MQLRRRMYSANVLFSQLYAEAIVEFALKRAATAAIQRFKTGRTTYNFSNETCVKAVAHATVEWIDGNSWS